MPDANPLVTSALALMKDGFAVIPIPRAGFTYIDRDGNEQTAGGKGPIIGGWEERRLSKEEVYRTLTTNNGDYKAIGVISGTMSGNLVVLDFDGEGWSGAAEAFLSAWPQAETSAQVRTGSGKLHIWLWCEDLPKTFTRKTFKRPDLGDGTAIELRGNKSQTLCPPSLHPSGGTYSWLAIKVDKVKVSYFELYNWLADWAGEAHATEESQGKPRAGPLTDPIKAGGRHTAMVSFAGSLRRRNASNSTILAAIREENALKCDPPLSDSELVSIANSMGGYVPADPLENSAEPINNTDLGNARRLIRTHGENIRYCHTYGKWLIWKGIQWLKDDTNEIQRMAREVVAGMYAEAAGLDDSGRKELAKWALRSEARSRLESMVALAQDEPNMPATPDQLDQDPMQFNVLNGTIDLYTGVLRDHWRPDMLTKVTPIAYHEDAECPMWSAFLKRIMAGNENLMRFLQRAVGYTLTGITTEQCLFFLHGPGANGKSTFIEILSALFGDYYQKAPTEMLMLKRNSGIPNDLARLPGARLVVAAEVEEGRRLAESLVKDLTGDDRIPARFLHQEWFDFKPTHKLWLYGNHKPVVRGTDDAIWRRIRLVPFNVIIPEKERNKDLPDALKGELEGILAWAVRGCQMWREQGGLGAPPEVTEATQTYRTEMDVIKEFLEDCCILGGSMQAQSSALYKEYARWCKDLGENAMTGTRFGRTLTERGYVKDRQTAGIFYLGIGLMRDPVQGRLDD